MAVFIEEVIIVAGVFFMIFSIMFCSILYEKEDSYSTQIARLRNHTCSCQACKQQATSNKQQATSNKQQAISNKQIL